MTVQGTPIRKTARSVRRCKTPELAKKILAELDEMYYNIIV